MLVSGIQLLEIYMDCDCVCDCCCAVLVLSGWLAETMEWSKCEMSSGISGRPHWGPSDYSTHREASNMRTHLATEITAINLIYAQCEGLSGEYYMPLRYICHWLICHWLYSNIWSNVVVIVIRGCECRHIGKMEISMIMSHRLVNCIIRKIHSIGKQSYEIVCIPKIFQIFRNSIGESTIVVRGHVSVVCGSQSEWSVHSGLANLCCTALAQYTPGIPNRRYRADELGSNVCVRSHQSRILLRKCVLFFLAIRTSVHGVTYVCADLMGLSLSPNRNVGYISACHRPNK